MQFSEEINSKKFSSFIFNLKQIYSFRFLLFMLIKKEIIIFYKQTILGPLWYIIQPTIHTIVFNIVFGKIAKLSTDGSNPFLFYFSGIILWNYFSNCILLTGSTFRSNNDVFSKIYFPRIIVPISYVFVSLLQFFVQFCLFIILLIFLDMNSLLNLSQKLFFLPLIIFQMMLMSIGVGCIVSAVTTRYRDLSYVVSFFVQIWMFLTPVVYPLSSTTGQSFNLIILLNPMTPIFELFRNIFFGNNIVDLNLLVQSLLVSIIVFALGVFMFNRVQRTFTDTI